MNKKLLLLAFLMCLLSGCHDDSTVTTTNPSGFAYTIINIEGCEYLKYWTYCYWSITHKGNCTNIIHQHNQ